MYTEGGMERKTQGPEPEELKNEIKARAEKLYGAYEKNVSAMLENKGLQHGAPDPEGHMHHAQQMLRILKTVQDPRVDPHHWPENFELPKDIPVVFRTKDGEVMQREIPLRNFDNPKKLVDSVEEILTVGQIEGL